MTVVEAQRCIELVLGHVLLQNLDPKFKFAPSDSMLGYLFNPASRDSVPEGAQAFTYHRTSGMRALILAFLLASLVELTVVHVMLSHWSHWLAWALTIASAWFSLQIIAQFRSLAVRPLILHEQQLTIRNGMFELVRIPVSNIKAIRKNRTAPAELEPAPLHACFPIGHNILLELVEPQEAELLYGKRRIFDHALLFVDSPEQFFQACEAAMN